MAAYMVVGAFVFSAIEAESQMREAYVAKDMRKAFARTLWNVTLHTNVLYGDDWRRNADRLVNNFQKDVIENVRSGYTGTEPGVRIWTFSSALMYSLTIFTTIGKTQTNIIIKKLLKSLPFS